MCTDPPCAPAPHQAAHGRIPAGSAVFFRSDWDAGRWPAINEAAYPGVGLEALRFLHLERAIQFHGHEPLDTDRLGIG